MITESQREAYLNKIKKKMSVQSKQDGMEIKEIDPERIAQRKEQDEKEQKKVMGMICPDIFRTDDRKHAIIVVTGNGNIRGLIECWFISKIPTAERENYILDATNEFGRARLKRKTDTGIERVLTEDECKKKIQDFFDRAKNYEQTKRMKKSFYNLTV